MLTREEKIHVMQELVGGFEPIADAAVDPRLLERQREAEDVLFELLCEFCEVSEYRDSPYASCEKAGLEALVFLKDLAEKIDAAITDY